MFYIPPKEILKKGKTQCPKCLRIRCNCQIIKEMKDIGWSVIKEKDMFSIITSENEKYKIRYVSKIYAWNFAVRRYKGEKRW